MADTINSVTATFGYTNTDFTRNYKISDVSSSALSTVEAKAKAINASLAGGTDGGLSTFFRADDYDASNPEAIVGNLEKITKLTSESVVETIIYTRGA